VLALAMTSCGLRRRGYATRQAGELQRTLAKAQAERQRAILAALQDPGRLSGVLNQPASGI